MAVMRLKKGIRVEVLSKRGTWQPAEIISGNGHTYIVKYDGHQPGMAEVTERVPRKVIRPVPPSVDGTMYWSPGNIVEALENHSWKLAQVSNPAAADFYFVRILGSTTHIIAHKSELRVRQAWKDNHWIIIQKDAAARFEDGKVVRRSAVGEEFNSPAPQPSREVKDREVEGQRKTRRVYLSERRHGSLNHAEYGFADAPRELNDAPSVSSSVGSCSPRSSPYTSTQDMDNLSDDADAYCPSLRKPYFPKKDDEQTGKFHHLQLRAYHRTLMGLYSSGPLTWELEAFLTNLRLQLHISNDEHLSELKHLASTQGDRESYA